MAVNPEETLGQAFDIANSAAQRLITGLRDIEPIGVGLEKVVYGRGDDKVIAFTWNSGAEGMKRRYYTQKLLHLILPTHIPDAHLAGSQPPVLVLDKITSGEPLPYTERRDEEDRIVGLLMRLGAMGVDYGPGNFIRDIGGNTYYVDSLYLDPRNSNALRNSIKKLGEKDQKRASRYATRIGLKL